MSDGAAATSGGGGGCGDNVHGDDNDGGRNRSNSRLVKQKVWYRNNQRFYGRIPSNEGTTVRPPPPVMNSGEPVLSKKMVRLRRTARKSVPGGPYRVEGFRLPEQVVVFLSEQALRW
ncbi:hypothetical protein AgCh_008149 [Apium graveolens]